MAGEIYQVTLEGQLPQNQTWNGVFTFQELGVGSSTTDLQVALAGYLQTYYGNFNSVISSQVTTSLVSVRIRNTITAEWDFVTDFTPLIGFANLNDPLPAGTALKIRARTTIPKRSGSKFNPGLTEGTFDSGAWTAAAVAAGAGAAVDYTTNATFGSVNLEPGTYKEDVEAFSPFTGVTTVPVIESYQTRRRQGTGI